MTIAAVVEPGPRVLPSVLSPRECHRLLDAIERLDARLPPDHPDRQPTSGSLRLAALDGDGLEPLVTAVRQACAAADPRAGGRILDAAPVLSEACWIRCQHPAATRPRGQFPHSWHQDGALGSRFEPGDALRALHTAWITLEACGRDAPSLAWVAAPTPVLLRPPDLDDVAVARRFDPALMRHAVLEAGDALLFDGSLLHRTHVTPSMTRRRISVELRFATGAAAAAPAAGLSPSR